MERFKEGFNKVKKISGRILATGVVITTTMHMTSPTINGDSWGKEYRISAPDQERPIIDPIGGYKYVLTGFVKEGGVSYYSRSGCLNCSPNRIMANGQPLQDEAFTLAQNELIGQTALVTNTENGQSVIAQVTDTGGYWKIKNRIADLTIGLKNFLGVSTDQTKVRIEGIRIIPSNP